MRFLKIAKPETPLYNYAKPYFVLHSVYIKKCYKNLTQYAVNHFFLFLCGVLILGSCAKTDQYEDTQINLSGKLIDSAAVQRFLTESLQDNAQLSEYHAVKGVYDAKNGDWKSASELLKQAIRLGDTTTDTRIWLIRCLVELHAYQEAQKEVKLLKTPCEYPEFVLNLAEMYYNLQEYEKALDHINIVRKVLKTDKRVQNLEALTQMQLGDSAGAWQTLKRLFEQDSTYSPAILTAFRLSVATKKTPQAFYYASAYLAAEPKPDTLFCTIFAQTWHLLKKYDTAAVWYEKAIQNGKQDIEAYLYLANYHIQRNNYKKAAKYLENILKINRYTPQVYNRLGYIYEYYLNDLRIAEKYYILARSQNSADTAIDRALRRVNYKIRLKESESMPTPTIAFPQN